MTFSSPRVERLVLHIGLHKTGTSTIQSSLEKYDSGQVRYAQFGAPNHGGVIKALVGATRNSSEKGGSPSGNGLSSQRARSILRRELQKRAEVLLMSAEAMSKFPAPLVFRLLQEVRPFVNEITVACFIREPVGILTSALQQNLKTGVPVLGRANMSYKKRLKPWHDALKPGSLKFIEFSPDKFVNGSLTQTLFYVAGIPGTPPPDRNTNEGISADAVRFFFTLSTSGFRQADDVDRRAHRVLQQILSVDLPGPRLSLSPDLLPRGSLADDAEWLYSETGIDFRARASRLNPDLQDANCRLQAFLNDSAGDWAQRVMISSFRRTGMKSESLREAVENYYSWARVQASVS